MKINTGHLTESFIKPIKPQNVDNTKGSLFIDKLNNISELELNATKMKEDFMNGKRDDVQNILIEGQKATMGINLALQVRNNMVSAFQQLMTMQL